MVFKIQSQENFTFIKSLLSSKKKKKNLIFQAIMQANQASLFSICLLILL